MPLVITKDTEAVQIRRGSQDINIQSNIIDLKSGSTDCGRYKSNCYESTWTHSLPGSICCQSATNSECPFFVMAVPYHSVYVQVVWNVMRVKHITELHYFYAALKPSQNLTDGNLKHINFRH